jgi:AAA15 family ATPase/GTPase
MIAQQKKPMSLQMIENKSGIDILKAGIIYGANASGKSNLVKALGFMKEVVVNGLKETLTFNKHFRLEKGNNNKPSLFEIEFQYQNKIYNYGFAIILSKKIIVEEWLYELNKNSQTPIFERQRDDNGNTKLDIPLKFGKGKKNENNKLRLELIGENLSDNELFLTEVAKKNTKNIPQAQSLLDVYKWFDDVLMIIFPHSKFGGIDYIGDSNEMTQIFCKFLDIFNTGINGLESKLLDFEKTLSYLPNEIKDEILKTLQNNEGEHTIFEINGEPYITHKDENSNFKIKKLMTKHRIKESEDYELFEINREESDGTRRIFDFFPALLMLANQESIFVIDEIDRSLHPILTKNIVDLFLKNTAGIPSQLIVTTHESSLLDLNFIRKDEIWFMEKNEIGESNLYSLDEFKPRADRMQIRKDYLLGRFGAIPFIANIEDLGWLKTENE